jgi:uncharacterized protein
VPSLLAVDDRQGGLREDRGVQITVLCPGNTESNFAKVANANAQKGKSRSDPPELVAKIGLDALLRGKSTVIPGLANHQVAILPRVPLTR